MRKLEALRRIIPARYKKKERHNKEQERLINSQIWLYQFDSLPAELQIMILANLNIEDLLNLRISCRAFNHIINSLGPALTRNFIKWELNPLMIKLYPVPAPDCADLGYMLKMHHRRKVCEHLSIFMASFFWREGGSFGQWPQPRNRKRRRNDLRGCNDLYNALIPLLFTLYHFFEMYRETLLDRAIKNARPGGKFELLTGGPTVWEDQMSILDKYHPSLILDCYHVYGYLMHIVNSRLTPPRTERFLRLFGVGSFSEQPSTKDLEQLYVLGGIDKLSSIIGCKHYSERRLRLDWLVRKYDPIVNPKGWVNHWTIMGIPESQVNNVTVRLPAFHLMFVPCALESLVRRRTIGRRDISPTIRTSYRPTSLIAELANWRDAEILGEGVHGSEWSVV